MLWKQNNEVTEKQINDLSNNIGIHPILARILLNRSFDEKKANIVMNELHLAIVKPSIIPNATKAANVITEYCKDPNAYIVIFGDYDCDGVTSTYIMTSALREVAVCNIESYLPERSEGYGLSMNFAESMIEQYKGKKLLVITVDNGVTQIDEIQKLLDNNIEVVVTDHHMSQETVPNCLIVDPHSKTTKNFLQIGKQLAGCGVAFKVAQLVQESFNIYNMMKYIPFVAIGTLGDSMPLGLENIAFIKYGLEIINSKECPLSIRVFKDFMGHDISSADISWDIAPCINACGRMGDVNLAASLFFNEDEDTAIDILNQMQRLNNQRKTKTDSAKDYVDTLNFDNSNVCIINTNDFAEGIIGIMAGKVAEKFQKPAIVVSEKDGVLSGSVRSFQGIKMQDLLKDEQDKGNIISFGGHDVAAGIKISTDKLKAFTKSINEKLKSFVVEETEKELLIDKAISINDLNENMFNIINQLPYDNKALAEPVFELHNVEVIKYKTSANNPKNICFTLKNGGRTFEIWAWGMSNKYKEMNEPDKINIAGNLTRNFMRPKTFTMKIIDFQEA